jgi:hypothetical protein
MVAILLVDGTVQIVRSVREMIVAASEAWESGEQMSQR